MPPDQHVNPAEEPTPASSPGRAEATAADGTVLPPEVIRPPAVWIGSQPPVTRIGRRPENEIVVSDLSASKRHAELRRTPAGRWSIIDLGSHDGTFVNGTRVSQRELNEGDIIAIGRAAFRLADGKLIEYADGTPGA